MNTELNLINANAKNRELRAEAAASRRNHRSEPKSDTVPETVIRLAGPGDMPGLRRLSELEGMDLPAGDVLVAVSGGEAIAAIPVGRGPALADPFRPTAAVVAALREARAHLRGERPPSRGRRIGAALGRLFNPEPGTGGSGPATPGGEGRLIR